jgi:hypothetical protein
VNLHSWVFILFPPHHPWSQEGSGRLIVGRNHDHVPTMNMSNVTIGVCLVWVLEQITEQENIMSKSRTIIQSSEGRNVRRAYKSTKWGPKLGMDSYLSPRPACSRSPFASFSSYSIIVPSLLIQNESTKYHPLHNPDPKWNQDLHCVRGAWVW